VSCEAFVCDVACLWKTIHALSDFNQDGVVVYERVQVVLLHDDCRDVFDGDSHVFVSCHRRVEIEILDIDRHEFCSWCTNDAVEQAFDGGEVGSGCADFAVVYDAITADGEAYAFGFGFVGLEGRNNA